MKLLRIQKKRFSFATLWCVFLLSCISLNAQKTIITGIVKDTAQKRKLEFASAILISQKDSLLITSTRTNETGIFWLQKIDTGKYSLLITYPQMADFSIDISVKNQDTINIGNIILTAKYHVLEDVLVKAAAAIRMKGDTLEYKADSFLVRKGATVEELLKKLPGIEVQRNGTIKAQGEKVSKILIDDDEFFADDPLLATRYLNAAAVDKVQVYNRKTEEATFTGVNDGKSVKTINLKLKANSKTGYFGGLGSTTNADGLFAQNGMLGTYGGSKKVFLNAGAGNDGSTKKFYDRGSSFDDVPFSYNSSDARGNPFNINLTSRYGYKWNKNKNSISANYSLQRNDNKIISIENSKTFMPDSSLNNTNENNIETSKYTTHSISTNFDAELDSLSKVSLEISFDKRSNLNSSELSQQTFNEKANSYLNKSNQNNITNSDGNNLTLSANWMKKLKKTENSITIDIVETIEDNKNTMLTEANNILFDTANTTFKNEQILQQRKNTSENNHLKLSVAYNHQLNKKWSLQNKYALNNSKEKQSLPVYEKNTNGNYDVLIDSLSYRATNTTVSNNVSTTLQFESKKWNVQITPTISFNNIKQQTNDTFFQQRRFINLNPQFTLEYKRKANNSIRFNYNIHQQQPSFNFLQPIKDKSNPLSETIGNPNLKQSTTHQFMLSLNESKFKKGSFLHIYLNGSFTNNAIVNNTIYEAYNKTKTTFSNSNGNSNINLSASFFSRLKHSFYFTSQLSIYQYQQVNFVNNILNTSKTNNTYLSFGLSNNNDEVDFSFHARLSYNTSKSTISPIVRNNFNHSYKIDFGYNLFWNMKASTSADLNFQPANDVYAKANNIYKIDFELEKSLNKKKTFVAKIEVLDLLNNNTGYSRNLYGNTFSESTINYLPRRIMLSLKWDFRHTIIKKDD